MSVKMKYRIPKGTLIRRHREYAPYGVEEWELFTTLYTVTYTAHNWKGIENPAVRRHYYWFYTGDSVYDFIEVHKSDVEHIDE